MLSRLARGIAGATMLALAAAACGGDADANTLPHPCDKLSVSVPPSLGGLGVKLSKPATKKVMTVAKGNSYIRDASVFEMRQGKELRAVYQVMRLSPESRPFDREWRRKIVGQIGGTSRAPEKVSDTLVYKARVNLQVIHIWFGREADLEQLAGSNCFMHVLIVRENPLSAGTGAGIDTNRVLTEALALHPTEV